MIAAKNGSILVGSKRIPRTTSAALSLDALPQPPLIILVRSAFIVEAAGKLHREAYVIVGKVAMRWASALALRVVASSLILLATVEALWMARVECL